MRRFAMLAAGGISVLSTAACAVDDRVPSVREGETAIEMPGGAGGSTPGRSPDNGEDLATAGDGVEPNDGLDEGIGTEGVPIDNPEGGEETGAPAAPVDAAVAPCEGLACPESTPGNVTLSLLFAGDEGGRARVTSLSSDERVCQGSCVLGLPPGTAATVRAEPPLGGIVKRWSDARCGNEVICEVRVDQSTVLEVEFEVGYDLAFVTSASFTVPELPRPGAAANQECARRAAAAGFPGTRWVAWLAGEGPTTALEDDIDPIESFQSTGGWVRPDGVIVARSPSALGNGGVLHTVSVDDMGARGPKSAWTGTSFTGQLARDAANVPIDCANWTSVDPASLGSVAVGNGVASNFAGPNVDACNRASSIICFGDDSDAEVPIVAPTPSRLAFLSTATFSPSTGIATSDAICQSEACAAGLTGSNDCASSFGTGRTFRSYLHTSAQPAWERFDLTGPTWVRPDGIAFLTRASDLGADGRGNVSTLSVTLSLLYPRGPRAVWTGDAAGTSTCADWTSSGAQGRLGTYIYDNAAALATGADTTCTTLLPVFCLEE